MEQAQGSEGQWIDNKGLISGQQLSYTHHEYYNNALWLAMGISTKTIIVSWMVQSP